VEGCDHKVENGIFEMAARILASHTSHFEEIWQLANEVCDRYQLGVGHEERTAA
jgi:hypothetical protein